MKISLLRWLVVAGSLFPLTIDRAFAQEAYLKASNTGARDNFGSAMAMSGNTLIVGAGLEDSSATGVNGNGSNNDAPESGAAYVFVRSIAGTWSQQAYLKASTVDVHHNFGRWSVAISGDTAVVGADGAPAAYVFVRTGTTWTQQARLQPGTTGPSLFGHTVAVSGNTIVVGAMYADNISGAAYVFVRTGTTWTQQASLKAGNPDADDRFSWSLAMSGDTVVVGAVQEASNATGVNGDPNNNSASFSGAAYVFVRTGTNWSQQAYLKASNTEAGDQFGHAVAVSGDTVVVGTSREASGSTGVNGDQINNNAPFAGAAYVFIRSGTTWTQQTYLKAHNAEQGDRFGFAVATTGDTVVVGATEEDSDATGVNGDGGNNSAGAAGAAYVFARSGTTWTQRSYLKASNAGADDILGYSAAVSGNTVVVGALTEASNATGVNGNQTDNSAFGAGAAYAFLMVPMPPLSLVCATNKTVECAGPGPDAPCPWDFDPPTPAGGCTNVTLTIVGTVTNSLCPMIVTRTWQATDACSNSATCSQTVTVMDNTPPMLSGCLNIVTNALAGTNGIIVSYAVSAQDNCDGLVPVTCAPPSGSFLFIGQTVVICGAKDVSGNSNSCSFTVTVAPACPGLVAWYKMEGAVTDAAGANNPSSTAGLTFPPGQIVQGVSVGSGGYIEIPQAPALDNQRFTMEAWLRPDGIGPNNDSVGSIAMTKNKSGTFYYGLSWQANGKFGFGTGPTTGGLISSSGTFPAGCFYHVAGTYDGANFLLYVNGVLQGSKAFSGAIDNSGVHPWAIGATAASFRLGGFSRTWNGVIDEVKLWCRALSAAEIQDAHVAGGPGRCLCLNVSNENVVCAPNAPGQLTYSLGLQNRTGVPVKYVFLAPKAGCFTFTPSVWIFTPPLPPGQTTNLSTMINLSGACPADLCFTISAHDSNVVQCCSLMRCVNNPARVTITCPTNVVASTCRQPVPVNYPTPTAASTCGTITSIDCTPRSGSSFPLGTNFVHCDAIDSRLNVASCDFTVTVQQDTSPACSPTVGITLEGTDIVLHWRGQPGLVELLAAESLTEPIEWKPLAVFVDGQNQARIAITGVQKYITIGGTGLPSVNPTCPRIWGPIPDLASLADLICLLDAEMAKEGLALDDAGRSYSVGYDLFGVLDLHALLLVRDAAGKLLSRNRWALNTASRHLYAGVWAEPNGSAAYTIGTHRNAGLIPNVILNQWKPGPGTPWTAPVAAVTKVFTPAALGLSGGETWGCRVLEATPGDLFLSGCTDMELFVARVDKLTLDLVTSWGVNGVQRIANLTPNSCPKHSMPGAFLPFYGGYPQAFIEIVGGRVYLGGTLRDPVEAVLGFDFVAHCFSAANGAPLWPGAQYSGWFGDDYMKAMAATPDGLYTTGTLNPSTAPQMQLIAWQPDGSQRPPGVTHQASPSLGNDVEAVCTALNCDIYVGGRGMAGSGVTGATWHYQHAAGSAAYNFPMTLPPQWAGAGGGPNPKPYGPLFKLADEVLDLGLGSGLHAGYCFATGSAHFAPGQFAQPLQCIPPGGGYVFSSPLPYRDAEDRGIAVNYHPGLKAVFTLGTAFDGTGAVNCGNHFFARNCRYNP